MSYALATVASFLLLLLANLVAIYIAHRFIRVPGTYVIGVRRQFGFARVRFPHMGITVEGDITKMRMSNTQEINLQFRPVDIHNNPTDEYQHGTERFYVKDGDASLVEIIQDPNFPLTATVRATGKNGVVQIAAEVDGDPGDGRDVIDATGALEIVSSRARSAELGASLPREQQLPPEATQKAGDNPTTANPEVSQAPLWEYQSGNLDSQFGDYPGEVVYTNKATGATLTLFTTSDAYAKMPMHAADVSYLLSFAGVTDARPIPAAGTTAEDLSLTEAQASPLVGETLKDSPPDNASVPDKPTEVVVDERAPSKFPMMGGAKVVESGETAGAVDELPETNADAVAQG